MKSKERVVDGAPAARRGRRGVVVALVGALLLAVPLFSLGTTASARGGHPESASRVCADGTYTVLSGDSWSRISSKLHVTLYALLVANKATTGMVIHPGDLVCLPAGAVTVATAPPAATSAPSIPAPSTPSATSTPAAPLGLAAIRQFPVQGACWFTDSYGAPRSGGRSHEGVDIIAKTGQLVYAADDGTLTKIYIDAPGKLPGNGWRLTRADGTYFFYGHLSAFAPGLKVGSVVAAGQILGKVGMTGNAGTPHLHFEVHPGGGPSIDPTPVVKAVNGCSVTAVPAQPGATPLAAAPVTAAVTAPTTTLRASSPPETAVPTGTTVPGAVTASAKNAAPSRWQFVAPVTAFDSAHARLLPQRQVVVSVKALRGVAPSTAGVLVRVVARNVTRGGYIALRSCSADPTTTTTLTFAPAQPNATTTIVPVTNGSFCLVANTAVDVRVMVIAYQGVNGVGMQPISAKRALDTRTSSMIAAGGSRAIRLPALGAPAGSKAVTVTLTLLGATRSGAIGVGPCGGTPWVVPFKAQPMLVLSGVMPVNDAGLCVTSTVALHLVVDSTGVWTGTTLLGAATPLRLVDTRSSGAVTPTVSTVAIAVPAGATRAQLAVTVITGAVGGVLRVWNCADAAPTGSVVPAPANSVMSVTVGMNVAGGSLCMSSIGTVHAILDLAAVG